MYSISYMNFHIDFCPPPSSLPGQLVQKLLGHHDPKVTMRYAHLSPQAMLEAVNVVGNVVGRRPVATNPGQASVALA